MSKIQVYHNNRCSKSNQAINYLKEKGLEQDLEIIYYLENPIAEEVAQQIVTQFDGTLDELIRRPDAKSLEIEIPKELTKEWIIKTIVEYPKVMQRPIVVKNGKAIVARPTENIDKLV